MKLNDDFRLASYSSIARAGSRAKVSWSWLPESHRWIRSIDEQVARETRLVPATETVQV